MFIRLFAYDILDDIVWTVVMHEAEGSDTYGVSAGEGTVPARPGEAAAKTIWRVLNAAAESAYQCYEQDHEAQKR